VPYAAALKGGAVIGAGMPFLVQARNMAWWGSGYGGPWANATGRFLGLVFQIDGKQHFGWARLTVRITSGCIGCTAGISGYAYGTISGKPIVAGAMGHEIEARAKPATLGMLALGSQSLALWRRKEE